MGLTVPAQTLQYSPRSLKPSTPISAPQLLAGMVGLVLAVMPCSTKPHGKPLHSRSSENACPLVKMTEIRVHFPKQIEISFPVSFHFNLHVQEKTMRDKDCMFDCEPQLLPHTNVFCFPAFSVFLPSVLYCTMVQQHI